MATLPQEVAAGFDEFLNWLRGRAPEVAAEAEPLVKDLAATAEDGATKAVNTVLDDLAPPLAPTVDPFVDEFLKSKGDEFVAFLDAKLTALGAQTAAVSAAKAKATGATQ